MKPTPVVTVAPARADVGGDFAAWVRPHMRAMATLAARMAPNADRDDVLQEALTAAWRKWYQFDGTRGTPARWLLAIVADQARKAHRRTKHTEQLTDVQGTDARPGDVDLERAIRRLAHRQRLAVALHYFLDLPTAEVAAVMGCGQGTVKSTLSAARARLREHLGDDYR